jgi:hypothetical protein
MLLRCLVVILVASLPMALSHGGMTTPLPRNSFGTPVNNGTGPSGRSGQALPHYYSNYYDDGCLVGCDACKHHMADVPNR